MKYKILIISFLFTNLNAQEVLSFKDAVKITLENNLNIKIFENFEKISKNNASILNSGYLPQISLGNDIIKSNYYLFSATMLIFFARTTWTFGISGNFTPICIFSVTLYIVSIIFCINILIFFFFNL